MATPADRLTDFHRLQAIVTDVDGTLYDQKQLRWRMLGALARAHLARPYLGWKTFRCLSAFRRAQEEIRWKSANDNPHVLAQFTRAEEVTGYPADFVRAVVARWMEEEPLAYIPSVAFLDARTFFSWAAGRGLRLAALSDYPLERKLQALGLADLFELAVSPKDDPGLRFKPDRAMLEYILRRLGVPADRALYVGDRTEIDGAVAKAIGALGVILSPAGQSGWRDGLLYVRSFTELKTLIESDKPS
jgi:phosphoglycolate phosphatase/putative hydrolase of the HAD superfamily